MGSKSIPCLLLPVSKAVGGEEMPGIVRTSLPPRVNKHDDEKPILLDGEAWRQKKLASLATLLGHYTDFGTAYPWTYYYMK